MINPSKIFPREFGSGRLVSNLENMRNSKGRTVSFGDGFSYGKHKHKKWSYGHCDFAASKSTYNT